MPTFATLKLLIYASLLSFASAYIFQCPEDVGKAVNDRGLYFEYYNEHFNANKSLDNFRNEEYGGRAQTYEEMLDWMSDHKLEVFGAELKNGSQIFESGCGEGLNLLITVELLRKEKGIEVIANGVDYMPSSVHLAHRIFDQEAPSNKGTFCQGDATDLSYIPSNSFDLAYTGFIDPIADPLKLWPDEYVNDNFGPDATSSASMGKLYCDEEDELLWAVAEREQRLQEDWHAAWVSELVRIAKPGALIVLEDVGYSLCSSIDSDIDEGWGGVDEEWWGTAPETYGWPVDEDSIEIMEGWYPNRYIVSMRKLKSTTDEAIAKE